MEPETIRVFYASALILCMVVGVRFTLPALFKEHAEANGNKPVKREVLILSLCWNILCSAAALYNVGIATSWWTPKPIILGGILAATYVIGTFSWLRIQKFQPPHKEK